jgi:hypothetical protein
MDQLDGLQVLSDEPIQGPAAFVEARPGTDPDMLAEELRAHVLDSGIAVPGARGPIDAFRRMVERLRGRTLIQDLGEHSFPINWLTFHVPLGGKGKLRIANTEDTKLGVGIGLSGLGFGSGRRITLTVNQDFRLRNTCLRLSQLVRARILAYATDDSRRPAHLQVDVLKLLSRQSTALEKCPDCQGADAEDAYMLEQAGPAIDLSQDSVGQIHDEELLLEDDSELELGLPLSLPGLEVKPAVAVNRSIRLRCTIHYEFPGSHCFTPYRRLDGWADLPFWRRA